MFDLSSNIELMLDSNTSCHRLLSVSSPLLSFHCELQLWIHHCCVWCSLFYTKPFCIGKILHQINLLPKILWKYTHKTKWRERTEDLVLCMNPVYSFNFLFSSSYFQKIWLNAVHRTLRNSTLYFQWSWISFTKSEQNSSIL